jgi:hypothetical protein
MVVSGRGQEVASRASPGFGRRAGVGSKGRDIEGSAALVT